MVKPRVKKTTRGEIPQELYEQAAYDVINGNAKVRTTAKNMECAIFLSGDLLLLRRIIKPTTPPMKAYTPEQVRPLPKADFQQTKRHYIQTKRKTAIITDTPEKQLLEELYNNRKVSSAKKKRYGI
ncbi:hypothetical protein JTB14_020764 [Gonioctena quinquepunctata]|nr:hypothetical protein JTB14_020764 [Gonioctena quinquepunctata]